MLIPIALLAGFLTVALPDSALAVPTSASVQANVPAQSVVTNDASAQASGLPERAAPPRTMRAYWHVFVAFAITWVLLFGFALSIGRRFGALEEEVRRLRDDG
jgi:CcmD family protein